MNRLTEILNFKKREVEKKKGAIDLQKLRERITKRFDSRSFAAALRQENRISLIAEVKKASPSAGIIRPDFNPTSIARSYEEGGASALSILTDEKFFQGHLKYLLQARSATNLPCLRKDFVIDEYQIWEARLAEADAVLLIVAALTPKELMDFQGVALEAELDALVEVHDERELDLALEAGARIIGINNRNLQTFEVDLRTTEQLVPRIPKHVTIVSESGIQTADHLKRLRGMGVHAVLVGESLMRQKDVVEATKQLLSY
jgi:indole-3-glycerol phosphate synthase